MLGAPMHAHPQSDINLKQQDGYGPHTCSNNGKNTAHAKPAKPQRDCKTRPCKTCKTTLLSKLPSLPLVYSAPGRRPGPTRSVAIRLRTYVQLTPAEYSVRMEAM